MQYLEAFITTRAFSDYLDLGDRRVRRSCFTSAEHFFDNLALPLEDRLYRSITAVAHPSCQA
jgi:hypothetical protein